ncbi:MAG: hypothetical protein KKE05_00865 [Nanoarchaeota archaeon]|nr:hypothetical protein [Nanoarchaeota archaeon]
MTKPIKKAGFAQGIYAQSVTAKETLGTLRITQDGRKFRYAKAGAADLAAGKFGLGAALSAYVVNEIILVAVAIGKQTLDLTITTGTAIAENELRGGYFQVQDGTGEGQNLMIAGNTAMAASGTTIQVALEDPIRVALDTTSEFNLVRSPWWAVYESDTGEAFPGGVAPIAVTTLYYYWVQTGGVAICLQEGTPAVGTNLVVSTATAGSVAAATSSIDIDLPIVGYTYGTAGVANEYTPIFLTID